MDQNTTLAELKDLVEQFVRERDWEQFHSPKNLSMAIAIEAAELMDLFKWHDGCQSAEIMDDEPTRQAASEEVADIIIFCLAFANRNNIDVAEAIRSKVVTNAQKYPADTFKGRF